MHLSHISSFFVSTVMRLVLFHASANASAWTDEASNYISTIFPFYWIRSPDFHLADAIKTAVDEARRHYETTTASLGVNVFHHETFGKQLCKEQKVSPDAMMQLGFQVRSTFSLSLSLYLSGLIGFIFDWLVWIGGLSSAEWQQLWHLRVVQHGGFQTREDRNDAPLHCHDQSNRPNSLPSVNDHLKKKSWIHRWCKSRMKDVSELTAVVVVIVVVVVGLHFVEFFWL